MSAPIERMAREAAYAENWPPLVPLDAPTLPSLNADALPGWAGEYTRALAEFTETPIELPAAMVLATCAAVAARRLSVQVKPGYIETANLWLLAALTSGNRKSAVQTAVTAPLLAWERDEAERLAPEITSAASARKTAEERAKECRRKSARANDSAEAKALATEAAEIEATLKDVPRCPQLWTSDTTPERLGILLAEHGECMAAMSAEGGMFDTFGGRYANGIPNLDLLLKAHAGDPERIERASRATVFLRHPRLTIGLSPQPEVLRGLADKPGFRGRGLLARFLYLLPSSPLGFRELRSDPVPERVARNYAAGIRGMLNWPLAPDEHGRQTLFRLRLSRAASEELHDFALTIEARMRPGKELEHYTDWAGKAPGAAARLAGVLHGIEHAHGRPWETDITAATMARALGIMAVIMQHSLAALSIMGADPDIAAARTVWRWIEGGRRAEFSVRDAWQALKGSFDRVKPVRDALDVLEERGYVEVIEPTRDGPGRRPSPVVRVRPDITEGWG